MYAGVERGDKWSACGTSFYTIPRNCNFTSD